MAKITIKSEKARAAFARLSDALTPEAQDRIMQEEAGRTLADLVKATPQKWSLSGARQSWRMEKVGPASYRVFNDNPVMLYLEEGTQAHGPVTAKALFIPLTKAAAEAVRSPAQKGKIKTLVAINVATRKKIYREMPGIQTAGKTTKIGFGQGGLVYGLDYILCKWVRGIQARWIARDQVAVSNARLMEAMKSMIRRAIAG